MQRGQDSFVYDSRHRLIEATVDGTTATYAYNVHHQRTRKTVNGTTTRFFYGPGGELLAEIEADSGAPLAEYVWLDGTPLAYLADDAIYHIHVDHLGTPQVLTDATGAINVLRAGHARLACEVSGAVRPPAAGTHRSDSGMAQCRA